MKKLEIRKNMNSNLILIILIIIVAGVGIYFVLPDGKEKVGEESVLQEKDMQVEKENLIVRKPAVAGQFYPVNKDELEKMIQGFLDNVDFDPSVRTPRVSGSDEKERNIINDLKPQILIVPHAGYIFSGQTTAHAFKQIQNQKYDKVILLGNSHQEHFSGLTLDNSDIWQTPLGDVQIDKEFINKLSAQGGNNKLFNINRDIHLSEHSLEVEIPFLQYVLGNEFKLILGLFGSNKNLNEIKSIAKILANEVDNKTLIIISTDLSHYPNYEDANVVDKKTIDAILVKDSSQFLNTIAELENSVKNLSTCACGWPAVVLAMELVNELKLNPELLNYTNSGETPEVGDKNRVVGYASILFTQNTQSTENIKTLFNNMLNQQEQKTALKLVRQTLEVEFGENDKVDEDYKNFDVFSENRGVFVTLHKDGELRGCIGLIEPPEVPLSEAISQMAMSAAFNDTRFSPLTKDELKAVEIEVSVLTVPKKVGNVDEIELGKHGVIVKKGINSGVFLPQVADETGWSKQEFLGELCSQKAGLDQECWKNLKEVDLYIFEAQVFSE